MSKSNDFEDALLESLNELVDDNGVAMRRRQEFRMRGGSFQADQFVDFMVDSPQERFYLGVEAKTAKASSAAKWYFSNYYPAEQVESQMEYGEKSGREMFVAIEVRDYEGDDYWLLFPIEYFWGYVMEDDKSIEWHDLVEAGIPWGDGLTGVHLDDARDMRQTLEE